MSEVAPFIELILCAIEINKKHKHVFNQDLNRSQRESGSKLKLVSKVKAFWIALSSYTRPLQNYIYTNIACIIFDLNNIIVNHSL